jgi:cytochrome c oxidase subunit 3
MPEKELALGRAHLIEEQFDTFEQQHRSARLGMWVFLATEVLFFGGLFASYFALRTLYWEGFKEAGKHTHVAIGAINTALLLTSSLTMALAIEKIREDKKRPAFWLLFTTALFGIGFIALKGLEYYKEYEEKLIPAMNFVFPGPHARVAELFYFIYFAMTGLHALHLTIGIGVVIWMMLRVSRSEINGRYFTPLELAGLYWHFIDLIWVFLFPFLYLMERYK